MRSCLLPILLFLQSLCYGQITFEEVTSPDDFNIASVFKSPIGEYFIQAANDDESIYTSMNGQDWTKTTLPINHDFHDVQFFSDGTPLLKPERGEHLIRRDGVWYTMNLSGGWKEVEASFIKDDSLFVFQDQSFAYSLDKGKTFTTIFTFGENIVDHTAHLWKFKHHFVLHHTAGASDNLSVFTESGVRIINKPLDFGMPTFTYNTCGQVLINDNTNYYLLNDDELSVQQGTIQSIIPDFDIQADLFCVGDHYYLRKENTISQSIGCDFSWEILASNDLIIQKQNIWINHQGDIFLFDEASNVFIEQASGSNHWEEKWPDINYTFVYSVDESNKHHQALLTSNALYQKNTIDPSWIKTDSIGGDYFDVEYSPNGNLYVNITAEILFSKDNGVSFSSIPLPETEFPPYIYSMNVLDDNVLVVFIGLFDQCYYTLNNGQDWVFVPSSFSLIAPVIKLVENSILMAEVGYLLEVTKINLETNEVTNINLGNFFSWTSYSSVIAEDGAIYFTAQDIDEIQPEGLYRYRFGETPEYLGPFQELSSARLLIASGNDLFGLGSEEYYAFNGEDIETHSYHGLPEDRVRSFIYAESKHLYVIINENRIFRSTEPLAYPQFITGTVYHDSNQDCNVDTLDKSLAFWKVKVEGENYLRIKTTDRDGQFSFSVPEGDYILSSQPLNSNWDICASSYPVTVDEVTVNAKKDFVALGVSSCADLAIDFSTPFLRRCMDNFYSIRVRNTGPEATSGTTLTLELDPFFDFISASIPYTLVGDSILKFDLGIMEVGDEISFQIVFTLSCDADLGMQHCLTGTLSDDNLCGNSRSTYTECQVNIGSFDPNDKRTFNDDGMETETVDKGEYIYYHIRFQNTGTDTAFNVKVIDPLSYKLDLSTLEMLSASQSYEYFISDGPALVVLFDDILLPDSSTNEPASHGFFKFRIKPLDEYDYGTNIPNQASIYFDFNAPVLTNEANLIIQFPVGTKEVNDLLMFNVFPNPTTNLLSLDIPVSDQDRIDTYEIIDPLGRRMTLSTFVQGSRIDVSQLTSGVYNLVLKENEEIIGMKKFVKM
ncbi:MAG TPA: T9SS type A sorting domain-containing protein [Saprospiraceae bacterium]